MTTAEQGNLVATNVWQWLQAQKQSQFVPWVIDPASPKYEHDKAVEQRVRGELLAELESVIMAASEEGLPSCDSLNYS